MEVYLPLSNLTKRLLTGVMLVVIITGAVLAGSLGLLLLLLGINGLGLWEFYRLFRSDALEPQRWSGLVLSSCLLVVVQGVFSAGLPRTWLWVGVPIAFMIIVAELYRKSAHPFHNLAFTFMGLTCISIPLLFFQSAAFLPFPPGSYRPLSVLGYFLVLWAADSGAFFTGKLFGRHKLFERLSPGKTWEGSLGGALFALLTSLIISEVFQDRSAGEWLILAAIILVTGTFGDLVKSMMKRSLHVKDSGTLLPGHGGILDRFDTLLGSAPFVFLYLLLFT